MNLLGDSGPCSSVDLLFPACTDPEQKTLSEFRITGNLSSVVKEQIFDSLMYVCLKGNVCGRTVPLKGGN